MEEYGDNKRRREEEEDDQSPEISSPEAKRLRDDLLLDDILDYDGTDAGDQDLASVMKSLEDEIAFPSASPPQIEAVAVVDQPDLGYLLEASDDELGLPPPSAPASSDEVDKQPEAESSVEGDGFGQIWGFDDEINGYDGLGEFGIRPEAEDVLVFDGGIFDYGDAGLCWPADFADLSWRSETLPAI
ncbi:hypothetical protein Cni_G11571 [Canna indica]|uniref:Uncharacterized protein n=1 Tax=Canna indica TaxID=4628 RepID=A0AAQ3KAH4_9LILI|nr:hypothetical protein Cni_G11571 [Canna indica]